MVVKKLLIFFLVSSCITISSLAYVNYGLLKDSSISIENANTVEISKDIKTLGYIPDYSYNICDRDSKGNKIILLSNNLIYIVNSNEETISIVDKSNFADFAKFINDDNVLYGKCNKNGFVELYIYTISNKNTKKLDSIKIDSSNTFVLETVVELDDKRIFFSGKSISESDEKLSWYSYDGNFVEKLSNSNNILKILDIEDIHITNTYNNSLYIGNTLFSYKNSFKYKLLGHIDNIVYAIDLKNNCVLSIKVDDTIQMLNEVPLDSHNITDVICSDSLYLVFPEYIIDLLKGVKIPLDVNKSLLTIGEHYLILESNGKVEKYMY